MDIVAMADVHHIADQGHPRTHRRGDDDGSGA
jgi:hypothetical protein